MGKARHKERRKESNLDIADIRNPNDILNSHVKEEKERNLYNRKLMRTVEIESDGGMTCPI